MNKKQSEKGMDAYMQFDVRVLRALQPQVGDAVGRTVVLKSVPTLSSGLGSADVEFQLNGAQYRRQMISDYKSEASPKPFVGDICVPPLEWSGITTFIHYSFTMQV